MHVNPAGSSNISHITLRTAAAPSATPASAGQAARAYRGDDVQLSDGVQRLRRAHAAAAAAPDARADRVADLKARVQAGTYRVDNQALAEKLLRVL